MITKLKRWIAPPVFDNERDTRTAYLLNIISISYVSVLITLTLLGILETGVTTITKEAYFEVVSRTFSIMVAFIATQFLMRRGNLQQAAYVFVIILWSSSAWDIFTHGGMQSPSFANFILILLIAGLLIGNRGAILMATLSILFIVVLLVVQTQGLLVPYETLNIERFVSITLNLVLSAIYLSLYVRSLDEALSSAATANDLLAKSRDVLELRVDERTQDLKLAAEVGRQVAQARDVATVLTEAATLIKDQFGLYQVQIYLTDAQRENLVLRASDGFAGARLLETGHQLTIDERSINGSAAYRKQAVIVANTQASETYRPHPLLPGTRSEMVVPLLVEGDVLGVIDLQSATADALTEDILPAFTVLAGQLAIAILNARQNRTIQENQRLMRTIIDATPDWIIVKSRDNRFVLVNQAFADYVGSSVDDMLGKNDIEVGFDEEVVKGNPEKGVIGFWPEDQQVMTSGVAITQKSDALNDFGQVRYNSTIKTPLKDENGQVIGLVAFIHDITPMHLNEETIAKRAQELQFVSELSIAAASTVDTGALLQQTVDLTKERFGLYHVHIYLLDESGKNLVLAAGAGDAGNAMVEEEISISLSQEQSLVARAARLQTGVIVNDVLADAGFLPNPLLPDTRSEMAVPMIAGNKVLGVLDVQAAVADYFSEQDIQIQTTLASQTAVALQNARQFEQTQKALSDVIMFRQLVDSASQGVHIADLNGESVYANQAFLTLHHHQFKNLQEELYGKQITSFYPEAIQARYNQEIIPTLLQHGSWKGELQSGDPENPTFTSETHFLLYDKDGNTTNSAVISSDITGLKETEAEIRTNQALMRTIIDVLPDWIIVKSRENRYLLVNQAFAETRKMAADEMVGKNDIQVGYNEELVRGNPEKGIVGFWPEDQAVMDAGEEISYRVSSHNNHGEIRVDSIRKIPLKDHNGNVMGLVIFVQDITQQEMAIEKQASLARALEEQLAQVNALQRAMTRDGWQAFWENNDRRTRGFSFTGESVAVFDETNQREAIGDIALDLNEVSEIAYTDGETAVALPLQVHGESIGIIGARTANGVPLNAEQKALLTTLTQQVAESLERARLFEETEMARSQTDALFTGSENVVRATTMQDILASLVGATALKNMDNATLFFFDKVWQDEAAESSIIAATWQHENQKKLADVGTIYSHLTYPLFQFLRKDAPSIVEDFMTQPNLDENSRKMFLEDIGLRTAITVPLVVGDQWIGFVLGLSATVYRTNENELRQIASLAGQAATVAQSQRLYAEAQSRAEREQILRQVSDRVYAAPDAETVLRTAAREIGQALGLETFIYLEDELAEEMVLASETTG